MTTGSAQRRPPSFRSPLAVLLSLGLLGAACSSGDSAPSTNASAASEARVEGDVGQTDEPGAYENLGDIEPITITVSDISPEDSAQGQAYLAYADAVTAASDGRITFEFHWAGSLLAAPEIAEGLNAGIADMGIVLPATHASLTPATDWLFGAGSVMTSRFPVGTFQGQGAHASAVLTNDDLQQEFLDVGIRMLAPIFSIQNFDALCTRPVRNLEEARGVTIRTGNETHALEAQAIGMEPVNLLPAELYEGFQRGVVDCVNLWPPISIVYGVWDIGQHYMPIEFSGYNGFYLSISEAV